MESFLRDFRSILGRLEIWGEGQEVPRVTIAPLQLKENS